MNTNCLDIIRSAIEGLPDEQIHSIIDSVVGGFVGGMIDDIYARKDEIVAEVVGNIVGHLAAAAQQAQLREVALAASKIGAPSANIDAALADLKAARVDQGGTASSSAQDAVQHICAVCGREGTRRYVQTATGWRCAPSSAKKCAHRAAERASVVVDRRFADRGGRDLPATGDIPVKRSAPQVAPAAPAASPAAVRVVGDVSTVGTERRSEPTSAAMGGGGDGAIATARCQDCNRAWTLTDIVLRRAVEVHELQKGHIVDVFDTVEGGAA